MSKNSVLDNTIYYYPRFSDDDNLASIVRVFREQKTVAKTLARADYNDWGEMAHAAWSVCQKMARKTTRRRNKRLGYAAFRCEYVVNTDVSDTGAWVSAPVLVHA